MDRLGALQLSLQLDQQPAACAGRCHAARLPVGLQLVGAIGRDDLVLRASRAYEAVAPFLMLEALRQY
jgi:Asp-tRNA(Asn)/Glu-tRNA(Gln) amidotransferase A subunit family amidase